MVCRQTESLRHLAIELVKCIFSLLAVKCGWRWGPAMTPTNLCSSEWKLWNRLPSTRCCLIAVMLTRLLSQVVTISCRWAKNDHSNRTALSFRFSTWTWRCHFYNGRYHLSDTVISQVEAFPSLKADSPQVNLLGFPSLSSRALVKRVVVQRLFPGSETGLFHSCRVYLTWELHSRVTNFIL